VVRVLRKPEESTLSTPRWEFVNGLWDYFEAAGRPTLEEISAAIKVENDGNETGGTGSTETIRRMLKGTTVPPRWRTARAVLRALCRLAGLDPDKPTENHYGDEYPSPEERFRGLWNAALNDPRNGQPNPVAQPQRGGWGGGYADEPPF
jgi:hypothetical protein